jgi:hypothetical protein
MSEWSDSFTSDRKDSSVSNIFPSDSDEVVVSLVTGLRRFHTNQHGYKRPNLGLAKAFTRATYLAGLPAPLSTSLDADLEYQGLYEDGHLFMHPNDDFEQFLNIGAHEWRHHWQFQLLALQNPEGLRIAKLHPAMMKRYLKSAKYQHGFVDGEAAQARRLSKDKADVDGILQDLQSIAGLILVLQDPEGYKAFLQSNGTDPDPIGTLLNRKDLRAKPSNHERPLATLSFGSAAAKKQRLIEVLQIRHSILLAKYERRAEERDARWYAEFVVQAYQFMVRPDLPRLFQNLAAARKLLGRQTGLKRAEQAQLAEFDQHFQNCVDRPLVATAASLVKAYRIAENSIRFRLQLDALKGWR